MIKRVLCLLLFVFAVGKASAQTTVSGGVFDFKDKSFPLEKVAVKNLSNLSTTLTDSKGKFTIAAKTGDLLEFTQFGYHTDTLLLVSLAPKSVFMSQRPLDIEAVDIKGAKISPDAVYKDPEARPYKRLSTDDLGYKKNTDRAGGLNLSLGYGKYKREKEKMAAITEKEMYEAEISEHFNEKILTDFLKISGKDLKDFMEMFRPTVDQVKAQRPFNYELYTAKAFHAWKKLPPEQRRLPPLPKLKANP